MCPGIKLTYSMTSLEIRLHGIHPGPEKNMVVVETSIMTISNPQKNACEDCLDAFILNCQKSSVSTRQTNSSKTCIDWLYSNSAKTVKVPYLLIADHTTKITYLKETENE